MLTDGHTIQGGAGKNLKSVMMSKITYLPTYWVSTISVHLFRHRYYKYRTDIVMIQGDLTRLHPPPVPIHITKFQNQVIQSNICSWSALTLAPLGGGAKGSPCGFSQIAPEVLGISFWNLPYLSRQQFYTLCQKIRTQVIIGEPWVTSEWRHVSPILTNEMGLRESPPLVQF